MKKYVLIILLIFVLFPLGVSAFSINNTKLTGPSDITTGKYFSLTFDIDFPEFDKSNKDTLGIIEIDYEIEFDDSIIYVKNFNSDDWDSLDTTYDGKHYITNTVNDNYGSANRCIGGLLYCSNYKTTINFYLLDTDKTTTEIKIKSVLVGLIKTSDINTDISEDDIVIYEGVSNKSITLNINKSDEKVFNEKEEVEEKKPSLTDKSSITQEIINKEKSSDNYLSSLTIENHNITFLRNQNEYNITVLEDENELKLDLKLSNPNATYKIIGADDLKANNYKVQIIVTAENGSTNTYEINAIKDISKEIEAIKDKVNNVPKEEKPKFKLNKNVIIVGIVVFSLIIVSCIIIGIICHKNNKKIDKELSDL